MHYYELIEILQEKFEIKVLLRADSPEIRDIQLMDKNLHHWNSDVIYIGNSSQLNTIPDKPIMLLSVDDPCILPNGSSCCRIRDADTNGLFNMAKDLIFEELQTEVILLQLAQSALDGKSIIYIMNTAAKLLGNALILVDLKFKVLAYSTIYEVMDPLWAENIERGHFSYEFIQKVRFSKEMKEWVKHRNETQIFKLRDESKLVARITKDGHVIGVLVMIAHHTQINRCHFKQIPLIGKMLFNAFNNEYSLGVKPSFYSIILYNLLDEQDIPGTLELITMSKAHFPSEMKVVVARFIYPIKSRYIKHTIMMELERIFPDGYSLQYKSYITILVSSISKEQKEKLTELARHEDITIGISWSFIDIIDFKRYFNQAVASIKQAHRFNQINQVFDYTDFSYYDLLHNYTGKIPLKHYCHPSLKVLSEYDMANNTEFYMTLKTYLENNKNLRVTADALFVHRNSLVYRIKRINELIDIDLNDINVVYSLVDSFRIETFLNSISIHAPNSPKVKEVPSKAKEKLDK